MESKTKKLCLAIALLCCSLFGYSQTFAEFFNQKKTQEKYLFKQLAYLKIYAGYLKKGYDVVSGGLGTIKDFTSGEVSLHEAFFSGLSTVGPIVKKDYRVAEMISLQLSITRNFRQIANHRSLEGDNKLYVASVREKVIRECSVDLDDLLDIVLSGKLEMSDEERLSRLSGVHSSMLEKANFTGYFCSEVLNLLESQEAEKIDIESIRRFYEKN